MLIAFSSKKRPSLTFTKTKVPSLRSEYSLLRIKDVTENKETIIIKLASKLNKVRVLDCFWYQKGYRPKSDFYNTVTGLRPSLLAVHLKLINKPSFN